MGVPSDQYPKVIAALKTNIKVNKGHLDSGIFGTQFFFEVLSENGMHDLAYEAINKRTEPSYGHWLELGATTSREQWGTDGSHNHPMFGGGLVWLYRKLAGMQADPEQPGYRHIIFQPQFIDDLDFVSYSNITPYGNAGITWKREKGKYIMDITVPVGSEATVYVPVDEMKKVTESGQAIDQIKEVQVASQESEQLVLEVGSGEYHFEF
jgi:alpha-L-rhamnosidase